MYGTAAPSVMGGGGGGYGGGSVVGAGSVVGRLGGMGVVARFEKLPDTPVNEWLLSAGL